VPRRDGASSTDVDAAGPRSIASVMCVWKKEPYSSPRGVEQCRSLSRRRGSVLRARSSGRQKFAARLRKFARRAIRVSPAEIRRDASTLCRIRRSDCLISSNRLISMTLRALVTHELLYDTNRERVNICRRAERQVEPSSEKRDRWTRFLHTRWYTRKRRQEPRKHGQRTDAEGGGADGSVDAKGKVPIADAEMPSENSDYRIRKIPRLVKRERDSPRVRRT